MAQRLSAVLGDLARWRHGQTVRGLIDRDARLPRVVESDSRLTASHSGEFRGFVLGHLLSVRRDVVFGILTRPPALLAVSARPDPGSALPASRRVWVGAAGGGAGGLGDGGGSRAHSQPSLAANFRAGSERKP